MDKYLENKFKGKYRIKAHYDQDTNDYIRDENGELDSSFADFYIKCAKGTEIRHGYRDELACYIPSKGRGVNILRQIYKDKIKDTDKTLDGETVADALLKKGYCTFIDITEAEVYFGFNVDEMDYIATLVQPSTSGANIGAMSSKNLPKSVYLIPEKDLVKRKEITKITKGDMKRIQYINSIDTEYSKSLPPNYKQDMKPKCMKLQQYIHSLGLWEDYLKFLKEKVDKD